MTDDTVQAATVDRITPRRRSSAETSASAWKGLYWRAFKAMVGRVETVGPHFALYHRGLANALDLRLRRHEVVLAGLPAAFDGYRLLHLTDLHLDRLDQTTERLRALVATAPADLCVMTGDYGHGFRQFDRVIARLGTVVAAVEARDGILATLGNHDSARLIGPIEAMGARVLVNETATLRRGDDALHLTGLDDVHRYYTEAAREALFAAPDGFKIALIHSAEIAAAAAEAGFALYLTGHTHGGQVCLPGGRPILTNHRAPRAYAAGAWRHGDMIGYTSAGAGVSMLPIRFNTRGEITLITLRRAP